MNYTKEEQVPKGAEQSDCKLPVEYECPICLQNAIHPVKLPCSHIFCFLCVKGIANRSKRCALCRTEIPPFYLHKPTLIKSEDLCRNFVFDDGSQWFYEGNHGWWQYDERTSQELEVNFKEECKSMEILIAGFLYIVDFENMIQYRRNDPSRRRRIKRDDGSIAKKGIAGLRLASEGRVEVNSKERQPDGEHSVARGSSNRYSPLNNSNNNAANTIASTLPENNSIILENASNGHRLTSQLSVNSNNATSTELQFLGSRTDGGELQNGPNVLSTRVENIDVSSDTESDVDVMASAISNIHLNCPSNEITRTRNRFQNHEDS